MNQDPPRSLSQMVPKSALDENQLHPARSHSTSAVPDESAPFNLDTMLETMHTHDERNAQPGAVGVEGKTLDQLSCADTANSLIDRHDMYKGVGRVETKDIRNKAHDWAT